METKTSELTGIALDWVVCEASGLFAAYPKVRKGFRRMWAGNSSYFLHPSTDWGQGGLIIERECMDILCLSGGDDGWQADKYLHTEKVEGFGPTPLTAAMRCYVASKLGEEVEVPDELCLRPCRSPYCECDVGKCSHPGCYDARGTMP